MNFLKILFGLVLGSAMTMAGARTYDNCSWDNPGVNPYKGTVEAAIDSYTDLSVELRSVFKHRIASRQFDELVTITRDGIDGINAYDHNITNMHFGSKESHKVCGTVTRSKWKLDRKEPAYVYCEGEVCILIPRICNNVSRIKRLPATQVSTGAHGGGGSSSPANVIVNEPTTSGGGNSIHQVLESLPIKTGSGGDGNSIVSSEHGNFHFIPWDPIDHSGGGICCINVKPIDPPVNPPSPVPEPDEWMMLLFGVGVVLFFAMLNRTNK